MEDTDVRLTPLQDRCEQEPIRFPSAIQPHGIFFCVDIEARLVLSASDNYKLIPHLTESPIGINIDVVWPELGARSGDGVFITANRYFVICSSDANSLYFDVEPCAYDDNFTADSLTKVADFLAELTTLRTLDDVISALSIKLRQITGMERILVYRFDKDGHGEVLAESRVDDWDESFLGFHFPAADIPSQARALYLINKSRFVPCRDYDPVAISPQLDTRTGEPFDLSLSQLRSVSPIHRIYQENLGVDGSMSVSIVIEGGLWGLVVGHHRRPHRVPIPARQQVQALISGLAMRLSPIETAEEREARASHVVMHTKMLEQIAGADDFVSPLVSAEINLSVMFFAASGAVVVCPESEDSPEFVEIKSVGRVPDFDSIAAITRVCRERLDDGVFSTDCIESFLPTFAQHAEYASGVLAITVGESSRHMILWFRPEVARTIVWGGSTPAEVEKEKQAGNYLPRRSFARWVEERRGHSRPWPQWKIDIARSLRTALNDVILRRNRALRSLNAQLEERDQAKSRFLAHMSHELRSPLNTILGFAELLDSGDHGELTSGQHEDITCIRDAGSHLLQLINDILDLSKVESGKMDLHLEKTDVIDLVRRTIALLVGLGNSRGVNIISNCGPELPAIMVDQRLARQMLFNLISNSLKFTSKGGTVTISSCLRSDGGITLGVTDTGIGIPKSKHARVLEPFLQAHEDLMLSHPGTGLGLPIVKSLIELHGGRLLLDSEPGKGTTITLEFPASATIH